MKKFALILLAAVLMSVPALAQTGTKAPQGQPTKAQLEAMKKQKAEMEKLSKQAALTAMKKVGLPQDKINQVVALNDKTMTTINKIIEPFMNGKQPTAAEQKELGPKIQKIAADAKAKTKQIMGADKYAKYEKAVMEEFQKLTKNKKP